MSDLKDAMADHVNKVVRTVALDLDQRVVLKTPVDTGRARANWLVGVNGPRRETTTTLDKTGSESIVNAANVIGGSSDFDSIWISNNLPYIGELENGSSAQTDNVAGGIVAISIQEVSRVNRDG